jgi:hypothetical protein
VENPNLSMVVAPFADMKSTGRFFARNSLPRLWLNQPSIKSRTVTLSKHECVIRNFMYPPEKTQVARCEGVNIRDFVCCIMNI